MFICIPLVSIFPARIHTRKRQLSTRDQMTHKLTYIGHRTTSTMSNAHVFIDKSLSM